MFTTLLLMWLGRMLPANATTLDMEDIKLSTGAVLKIYKSSEEKANGRAMLIIPGGGYSYVSSVYEGTDCVPMFKDLGYTAAILIYTTPPTAPDGPLKEAREAMRYLREHAEDCHVTTGEIGVIGFSAGGHLASTVATHVKGEELPAFQILVYPVITMDASYTHMGSRNQLLGGNPSSALVNLYSNEKQVTKETPMAYICWAENDGTVPPRNSISYAAALRRNGVSVHTKSFPSGGHGFSFKTSFAYHDEFIADLTQWLLGVEDILNAVTLPTAESSDEGVWYNLAGQRITTPRRGIYVTQGHKLLIK